MATTFGPLVARIVDETTRPDLEAQIRSGINQAVRFYNRQRFWFTDTSTSLVTVAGSTLYDHGLSRVDSVFLQRPGGGWEVRPSDWDWIERNSDTVYRGEPSDWASIGTQIRLYPTPDRVYALTLKGARELAALSADTDTNAFLAQAEDLIAARVRARLYATVIREESGDAAVAAAQEQEELRQLMAQGARRGATGQVRSFMP